MPLYKDLLKVTHKTRSCAEKAMSELDAMGDLKAFVYAAELRHFLPLVSKVIEQTERRVLRGEHVPALEKLVPIAFAFPWITRLARCVTR